MCDQILFQALVRLSSTLTLPLIALLLEKVAAPLEKMVSGRLACCRIAFNSLFFMLFLDDNMIFARGGRRICYVHPEDPGKCVKVLGVNGDPAKRRAEAVWYKKLRPLSMFNDNLRELKAFKVLGRHGERVWCHFPRCYGLVETNKGLGIVTELIRNDDRDVPLTLHEYLATNGKTPELFSALEAFFCLLRSEIIITREILDHNIIVRESQGSLFVYMIDGFGSSDLLPFSSLSRRLGRRKVDRKIRNFYTRYMQ